MFLHRMSPGSAATHITFLLWLLVVLPSALNIVAQPLEVGDLVGVIVSTNAFDARVDDVVGCPPDGCTADNTRDGDLRDVSRWSCSRELVADGGGADGEECRIVYQFSDALAAVYGMSVAFYKGDERTRRLNVEVNGVQLTAIESGGSTSGLETFELYAQDVVSLGLESVGLPEDDDFLSIIEVRLYVSEDGATTPGPTFSDRDVEPAPSSSNCGVGTSWDGESPCVDGNDGSGASVDDASQISTRGASIWVGIVTAVSLFFICKARKGGNAEVTHCKLILQAYLFSTAEGVALVVLVPSSKESLKIGAIFFFGFLSALSALLLRRAGKDFWPAVANAALEAIFALVTLFVFVEQSTGTIFLFGALAANEALIGFAIGCYASSPKESPDPSRRNSTSIEEANTVDFSVEICFLLCEALNDAIVPLVWTLLRSLFHSDSAWRSDTVFTLWTINGGASFALVWTCFRPPFNSHGFGAKAAVVGMGFFNGTLGVMSFVLLWMTERDIEDPPTFEVVWSAVWGTLGVLGFLGCVKGWYIDGIRYLPDNVKLTGDLTEDKSGQSASL